MGAVSYEATHYRNGRVDVKAECDEYMNDTHNVVLRSTMRGSIYYALVYHKGSERREPHKYIMTAKTSTARGEFYIKEVSEDMGPAWSDCPVSYLDAADAPINDWARAWRDECRARAARKKRIGKAERVIWHVPAESGITFMGESLAGRSIPLRRDTRKWWASIDGLTVRVPLKYVSDDDIEVAA